MKYNIKLGAATLLVETSNHTTEFFGDTYSKFSRNLLNKYCEDYHLSDPDIIPDEEPIITNADDCICLLWWIMMFGKGTYRVQFSSTSDYWLFHDLVHARRHTNGGTVYVTSTLEEEAFLEGAKEAFLKGVPLSSIVKELVKGEEEFQSRFREVPTFLSNFLDYVQENIRG